MSAEPKVWFITGAMSGFGQIMSRLVLENGDNCVATSIDPSSLSDLVEKYGPTRLITPFVDVTKPEEIAAAFTAAHQAFGGVDVVLNNAGIGISGIVEAVPEATARKVMDVNFWGATSVSSHAVRFFREVNAPGRGGKILVMSSTAGIDAGSFMGYYAASKHALEAIHTSIRKEVKPEWNIQIMLIEPGWMKTGLLQRSPEFIVPTPEAYGGDAFALQRRATIGTPGDPVAAMKFVHEVAQREKLPVHLPIGKISVLAARDVGEMWTKVAEEWEEAASREEFGVGAVRLAAP